MSDTHADIDWIENFQSHRDEFERLREGNALRVVWFWFDDPKVTCVRAGQYAVAFVKTLTNQANVKPLVTCQDGQLRYGWCALMDGLDSSLRSFEQLAFPTFKLLSLAIRSGRARRDPLLQMLPAEMFSGLQKRVGEPMYMYWVCAAALIGRNRPHSLLALRRWIHWKDRVDGDGNFICPDPPGAELAEDACQAGCVHELFMEEIDARHMRFDEDDFMPSSYQGPPVHACGFIQDVWLASTAALDQILLALGKTPGEQAPTSADETGQPEGGAKPDGAEERAGASANDGVKSAKPGDLIKLDAAKVMSGVSRNTLLRHIDNGTLKSYRPPDAADNAPYWVSEADIKRKWPRE